MNVHEAWILLVSNLPYNMGYEGDEIEEMSAEIAEYNEAIEIIERHAFNNATSPPVQEELTLQYPYSKD